MSGSSAHSGECRSASPCQTGSLSWACMLAVVIYWAEGRACSMGFIWTFIPQQPSAVLVVSTASLCPPAASQACTSHPVSPLFLCVALEVKERHPRHVSVGREDILLTSWFPLSRVCLLYQQAVHLADTLELGCLWVAFNKPWFCNINTISIANTLAWFPKHCQERKKSQIADIYTRAGHYMPYSHHCGPFST